MSENNSHKINTKHNVIQEKLSEILEEYMKKNIHNKHFFT